MAGLHFDITGDNSNFMRKLDETRNGILSTSKQIEESGISIEQMFERMTKAAAAFGVGFSAQQFVSQVTKVRGEFQQLEVAFNTMLGSKEQADTLMSQFVRTAAITPFDLQGVANGAKQLLAYGTAADDVNGTLVRLGDIAAGLSIPLNDLVWLYGTTMTQGRLFTQDLRQFQGRGIPLADELAKQFGVTKDKVGELVTAGKVGFPEVQKAIESMTNEGGRFGGLMEAQSKTITGQISNIEDAIATAFNKIGKENESIINSALSGTAYLVEHWEDVAIAIESAAVAYGTYKAAVMTVAAIQGAESTLKIDAEIEGLQSLLVVKEKSKNADLEAAVASGTLTEAKAMQLASLREELATRLSVLKLKEEEAIAEHASALAAFDAAKQTSDAANDKLEKMNALYEAALAQGDASYEQYAMEQLQTASANANTASTALNTAEKNLNAASSKRKAATEAVDTMATQANTVANHANTASMNIMKLAGIQLTTMLKGMWATLMANPLMLVAGAVIGLAFALYKVATAETEAETATRMYNEALDEQQKKQEEYKEKIDSLIKAIDDNNKSEGERLQAFEALKAEYPTVLNNLLTEAEYLKDVLKYKKLIAEEDNNRAKQSDEKILEEEKRKLKYYQDVRKRGTSTTLVDMDGNGWASDNVEDAIKSQQEIVNKAIAKVASHDVTSYLGNIKDMKDGDIISMIDGINVSLKALEKSGDDAIAIVSELGGEYSKSQLSSIKNALETEQKSRSSEKSTGKERIEKYKNSYIAAKKELDDFLNSENKSSEIEYEKKLKELTDKKDEAEKKYKSVGGVTNTSKQESAAEKLKKEQEKRNEELLTLQRNNQKSEIDLMEEGSKKKIAQIELDYKNEIATIKKQEEKWSKAQDGKLTEKQSQEISIAYTQAEDKKDKGVSDVKKETQKEESERLKAAQSAWNEYYQTYGTWEQKRLALAKEYQQKIKEVQNDKNKSGDEKNALIATLQKEWDEALANLNLDKLKQDINWEVVFGDMSKVAKKQLQQVKKQLQEFKKSPEFKTSTPEQIKVIEEALNNINTALVDKGGFFGGLTDSLTEYEGTVYKVKEAQEELEKALKSGDEVAIEKAKKKKNAAEQNQANAQANVEKSKDKAISNITAVSNAIVQLGKENVSLSDIGNTVGTLVDALSSSGTKIGGIISAILSIIDAAGEVGTFQYGMDIIENISSTVTDAFARDTESITGLDMSFMKSADYDDYNELVEQYDTLIDVWDQLLDKKKAYIKESYGIEATKAGQEALDLLNSERKITRELASSRLDAGASSGSHSMNYRMWKGSYDYNGTNWKDVAGDISKSLGGVDFSSMWSMLDMSSEQLEWIKINYSGLWASMDGDFRGYLDDIIQYGDTEKEILKSINEQLTQTSFDSLFDSFLNTLMDMDASSKDFADSFEEYMRKAIFTSMFAKNYEDELTKWYEAFAEANKKEEGITEDDVKNLRNRWDNIVNGALSDREAWEKIVGSSGSESSREASKKGVATASQDSVDELNGRFTVIQGHTYEINSSVKVIQSDTAKIAEKLSFLTSMDKNMSDMVRGHDIIVAHLSNIEGYTANLVDIRQFMYFMKLGIDSLNTKGITLKR